MTLYNLIIYEYGSFKTLNCDGFLVCYIIISYIQRPTRPPDGLQAVCIVSRVCLGPRRVTGDEAIAVLLLYGTDALAITQRKIMIENAEL